MCFDRLATGHERKARRSQKKSGKKSPTWKASTRRRRAASAGAKRSCACQAVRQLRVPLWIHVTAMRIPSSPGEGRWQGRVAMRGLIQCEASQWALRGRSPAPSNLLALFWRGANTGGTASRPRADDSERVVSTGRGGTGRLGAPSERRRRVAGGK